MRSLQLFYEHADDHSVAIVDMTVSFCLRSHAVTPGSMHLHGLCSLDAQETVQPMTLHKQMTLFLDEAVDARHSTIGQSQ